VPAHGADDVIGNRLSAVLVQPSWSHLEDMIPSASFSHWRPHRHLKPIQQLTLILLSSGRLQHCYLNCKIAEYFKIVDSISRNKVGLSGRNS